MKRAIMMLSIVTLALLFVAGAFAGGKAEQSSSGTSASSGTTGGLSSVVIAGHKLTPLAQKTSLTFATTPGQASCLPLYIAQQKGWLAKLNINLKILPFDNGPAEVEAMAANGWDFAATGLGGVFSGVLGYGMIVLADQLSDDSTMDIFARKDDPIVKAGKGNVPGHPDLWGTAATWKGRQIMCPAGTILEYLVVKTLAAFGLTEKDASIANMSTQNVAAAFNAGQGKLAAVWHPFNYQMASDPNYVMVSSAPAVNGLGATGPAVLNPNDANNAQKMAAIIKCLEVHFAIIDWLNESTANFNAAAADFYQMNLDQGVKTTQKQITQYLHGTKLYTFEESYKLQTQKTSSGNMTLVEQEHYDPLKFFVSQGKYPASSLQKLLGGYFPTKYVDEIKAARDSNTE